MVINAGQAELICCVINVVNVKKKKKTDIQTIAKT